MAPADVKLTFAEKQLAKYGWKKGMGLGKMNDGISEPIKVKTCKNNLGIGNDPKKHFSHWWDMAYNRAVNNIIVERTAIGNIEVKSSSVCSITQEKPNVFNSSVLYDDFQQAGTLKGIQFTSHGKCHSGSESSDSEGESRRINRSQGLLLDMSDAELLKLCGGGTAHKGARHGLRMGGKMKRLKAMEEADAARAAEQRQAEPGTANCLGSGYKNVVDDRKIKKSSTKDEEGEKSVGQKNCNEAPPKNKKKSKRDKIKYSSEIETNVGTITDTEPEIDEEYSAIDLNPDEPACKHTKHESKGEDAANIPLVAHKISAELPIVPQKIKKRKKKCKHMEGDDAEESQHYVIPVLSLKEKRKKKYKSSETISESENELNFRSKTDDAGAGLPQIFKDDPSSDEITRKKKKRNKQIHETTLEY